MALAAFLSALFADGRVRVRADGELSAEDVEQSQAILTAYERENRDELPATPPEFLLAAAMYGAETLHRACQFLVFRDVEPAAIQRELGRQWQAPLSASVHYSADLTLRFLPDVVRLAHSKSSEDPLVSELIGLAGRWPLSGVGITGAEEGDIGSIVTDACLLGLYVDRIMARRDVHRLKDRRVQDAAWRAMGAYPDLAPEIAAALNVAGGLGES